MIAWLLLLVTGAHAAAAHVVLAGETVETIALALGDPSLATAIRTDNDIAPGAQPAIGAILILPDAVPGISCEPSYVVHHVGPLFRRTAPDAASPTAFHYDPLGDLAPLSLGDTVCTGPVVATGDATDGYARLDLSVRPSDGTRDAITLLPGTCVTITAVDRVRDQRTSLVDLKQGAIIVEGGPQPGDVIVRTGGSSPDRSAVTVGHRGGFRVWAEPAAARTEAIGSDVSTTAQGVQVVLPEGFGGRTAYGEKPSDPHPLPPPPTLVRPDDGAVLLGPDFRWQPGGPAAQYVISFALPGDLSVPIQQDVVARPIFAPQWPETLALPAGDGVWSWQVMSVDAEGFQGKPSAFRAFRAPGSTP